MAALCIAAQAGQDRACSPGTAAATPAPPPRPHSALKSDSLIPSQYHMLMLSRHAPALNRVKNKGCVGERGRSNRRGAKRGSGGRRPRCHANETEGEAGAGAARASASLLRVATTSVGSFT